MATTQLQLGAWGGRRYGSFAGRVAVTLVYGPVRSVRARVFHSGAQESKVLGPRSVVANVIHSGGVAAEVN